MAGEGTLKNLERLKGQNWPLKGFFRHVKNDISLHAKSLGYVIFKEVVPPPGAALMKTVRRGQPPAIQLSKEVTEVEEEEEVMEVPEPVCGRAAVNVVSSPEDDTNDRKTVAELMEDGKKPTTTAKPKVIPKSDKGIVIGEEKERNKAEVGQEEKREGRAESPYLDLVLVGSPRRKGVPLRVQVQSPRRRRGKVQKKRA
ncbi:hypothetical protein AXF42_Ash002823 [Apostasia shenzhenica]|uniref:Uncharacterized protein n=1 Tax=Apostasia shenzhenica TaxID=1088818 RepID=A0A2I0A7E4_9ASPA|nr:hypothetical protein AXF42_Ash002823 [Apostasia shenzhenica]